MHHVHINPIKNRMYIILKDGNASNITAYVDAIENACRGIWRIISHVL